MFTLKSPAFSEGGTIPEKYAEKSLISPPLSWSDPPKGAKGFALTMTDPDVPEAFKLPHVFVHWMVYNIPASTTSLPEGCSPRGKGLPAGAKEFNSDYVTFKTPGYGAGSGGPWPPDAAHRHVFTLYALKTDKLDIPAAADVGEFAKAVVPQTIGTTSLIGVYGPAKSKMP
ncbi:MAG: YbhB/YbcL family Raf kinase inhibitor-like protein [Chloroflexi bacterium]|nr:YbhB/YbcL family Raf kinase inhibitor-like protein [Chloroflexota bacterium]